jgi:hypothetical protein
MVAEIIQNSALLRPHGARLEALTRDVAALRNDVTELRRGQEELHVRLDRVETRLDRQDTTLAEVSRKLDMLITAIVPPGSPPPA